MKNTIKRAIAITMAVMTMATTSAVATSANEWVKTDGGYKYELDNGSYQKKGWLTVGNDKFYINTDGTRAVGTKTFSNKDGSKAYYYFDTKTGKMVKSKWLTIKGVKYYYRSNGQRATNTTIKISGKSYTFDATGTIVEKIKGSTVGTKPTTTSTTTTVSTDKPATVTFTCGVAYHNLKKGSAAKLDNYPNGHTYATNLTGMLSLYGVVTKKDLDNLKYFTELRSLEFSPDDPCNPDSAFTDITRKNLDNVTNLDFCKDMKNLEKIFVGFAYKLSDASGIANCTKLSYVAISYGALTNVDFCANLINLKELRVDGNKNLTDIKGLVNCKKLEIVTFSSDNVSDISVLSELTAVINISFAENKNVTTLPDLSNLKNLEVIYLTDTSVKDCTQLINLKSKYGTLRHVGMAGTPNATGTETLKSMGVRVAGKEYN